MTQEKIINILNFSKNIDTSLNEINNIDSFISRILNEDNFNKMNNVQNNKHKNINSNLYKKEFKITKYDNENIEFISIDINSMSPYKELISEKEFYKIVGVRNKHISSRSGKYQMSLYSNYLEAKKEKDNGYISDILRKAIVFQNNLNYVRTLTKNKKFMKEWRHNFGKESPIFIFKTDGKLKKINIINSRIR